MHQQPTAGRIVHYVSYGTPNGEHPSVCRPAMITEVGQYVTVKTTKPESFDRSEGRPIRVLEQWFYDDACALVVHNPTGQFFNQCEHDEERTPGTWHWPQHAPV